VRCEQTIHILELRLFRYYNSTAPDGQATWSTGVSPTETRCKHVKLPLYLLWRRLKDVVGWPYNRTQTGRLMSDPAHAPDAFPACQKLGAHRNSHPIWCTLTALINRPYYVGERRLKNGEWRG
jgi:hypothetical protein